MGVALVTSVFAVHWKHQYKMWQVKSAAAEEKSEKERRFARSSFYLTAMRAGMWVALISIAIGFLQLLAFLWITVLPFKP